MVKSGSRSLADAYGPDADLNTNMWNNSQGIPVMNPIIAPDSKEQTRVFIYALVVGSIVLCMALALFTIFTHVRRRHVIPVGFAETIFQKNSPEVRVMAKMEEGILIQHPDGGNQVAVVEAVEELEETPSLKEESVHKDS